MSINPDGLHRLIKNHGILLEHQAKDKIVKYFSEKDPASIQSERVGLITKLPQLKDSFEIDVYIDVICSQDKIRYSHKLRKQSMFGDWYDAWDTKTVTNHKIRNLIVAECKGHPQDGFLLCRIPSIHDKEHEKREYKSKQILFVSSSSETTEDAWHEENNTLIVDWAQFCKVNEGKSKLKSANKNLSDDWITYQEDKDKFNTAIEQTNRNILYLLNRIPNLLKNESRISELKIIRFIPIIVTNAPICGMVIGESKVQFLTLPWITFLNTQGFAREHGLKDECFKFIYVVNFGFLNEFFDAFLSFEQDFGDFPKIGTEFIPELSFEKSKKPKTLLKKNKST